MCAPSVSILAPLERGRGKVLKGQLLLFAALGPLGPGLHLHVTQEKASLE